MSRAGRQGEGQALHRLLIDECLSPDLVQMALDRGHDATHVTYIGLTGMKDWDLKPTIIDGDWTFVTKNSIDFRGPADSPGTKGQYADIELHAGLICINGPGMHRDLDLDGMIELFEAALDDLQADPDLINKVLEVTMAEEGIDIVRYHLPASPTP